MAWSLGNRRFMYQGGLISARIFGSGEDESGREPAACCSAGAPSTASLLVPTRFLFRNTLLRHNNNISREELAPPPVARFWRYWRS